MLESLSCKKPFLIWCLLISVVVIVLSFSVSLDSSHALDATTTDLAVFEADKDTHPERVLGLKRAHCKKCHASEVAAWMKTTHYKTKNRLSQPEAKKYIFKMGINAANVRKNSMCLDCHGTKTADADGTNVRALDDGVSCSSCHGGSGGKEDGWLNTHQSFHELMPIPAAQETEKHRKMRIEKCEKAGMIRPVNVYGLARNCLSCHIISNQKLVEAGHSAIDKEFEIVAWTSGEVRHNFQQDQKTNRPVPSLWAKRTGGTEQNRKRTKFVVGLLVELEMCVKNLSNVSVENGGEKFAEENVDRVVKKKKWLKAILEALGNNAPAELTALYNAVNSIEFSDIGGFENSAAAQKALPIIAKNAKAFANKHDASKLEAIDKIMSKLVKKPKGDVWSPGQSPKGKTAKTKIDE